MMQQAKVGILSKLNTLTKVAAGLVLAAGLAFGIVAMQADEAMAEEGGYRYTVTLSPGNGTINGSTDPVILADDLKYDQTMTISFSEGENGAAYIDGNLVEPPSGESRYFVQGIRLAGADEKDLSRLSFKVTSDMQFVVSYGLAKDTTRYRVDYVDTEGNELAEPQYFEGNIGDKPVAAYKYIEGYVPNAFNITGTLQKDELKNVFRFVYRPLQDGESIITIYGGRVLGTGPSFAMNEGAAGADGEGADAGAEGIDGSILADRPVELMDIDDEETPLAGGAQADAQQRVPATGSAGISVPAVICGIIGLLAVVALLVVFFMTGRKKKRQ
ncbi:MAG: MucBP domain-containing protein [Eggerthellaceae bacterium]|nr:MucBP domain-containing protein [Eggerthellaceae bacterium]